MPKPSVDTLLADPDFQALDIEGKREILGDVSPSFKVKSLEIQNQALSDIGSLSSISGQPPSVVPRRTSPTAQQDAFTQQFIAEGTQDPLTQALSALTAPVRAGTGLATGLADILYKGVQGVGSIYGKAAGQPTLSDMLKSYGGDVTQTIAEIGPRIAYELGQGGVAAFQSPETSAQTLRSLSAIQDPLGAAMRALVAPQAAPTEARAQQAFEEDILNRALAEQGEQGIAEFAQKQTGLVPAGTADIDVARAAPLLLGAGALPRAALNVATKTLPNLIRQGLRTGSTIATTPLGSFPRAARAAEPFLSGTRLAEAQAGVESALSREAALQRGVQESLIKEQAAGQQAIEGVAEARGAAALKGREALAAQRELTTAQGTITPEIVQAQTSITEAAQLPPVILGRTAEEASTFGRGTISAIEKPMRASESAYEGLYADVAESLPSKQPKVAAQPLFDAAKEARGELSQGFEAYNKGTIKSILDESTKLTKAESTVPPAIQNLYDSATPQAKADLLQVYPDLATGAAKGKIPTYNWNELQARFRQINQGINQALKYGDTNDARILGNLKRGITDSMENYASKVGGDTLDLFKDANASYAAHQNKFGLNRVQTLFKDDVLQNPELVARDLIAFDNPSQVNAIKGIVTAEEFVPVQAQFSQKFFSPTPDVPFDPSHFVKQFSKPGARETVKAVFGEEGLANFNQIYDASKSFAKVQDLQKTLDTLASQSEKATEAFSKARAGVTETERALGQKLLLKAQLKDVLQAGKQAGIEASNADITAALKELDRVKNYRDLKDWGTRVSGLNILEAATTSPAWEQLARYSALHLDKYQEAAP